ncbi:reverse transcriptase domain-containing protein [Vairimorpha necatrix]
MKGNHYKADLLVVNDLNFDVIVGRDFMRTHGIRMNYDDQIIVINNKVIKSLLKRLPSDKKIFVKQKLLHEYESNYLTCKSPANFVEHKIQLNTPKIVCNRNYSLSIDERNFVQEEVSRLLEEGIIEDSTSRWSFPIVVAPKRDGKKRLCIDFRELNEITGKEVCQPPLIEECLTYLSGAKIYTQLDLEKGIIEERTNQSLLVEPSKFMFNYSSHWDNVLSLGLLHYRLLPNGKLGMSSLEILNDTKPVLLNMIHVLTIYFKMLFTIPLEYLALKRLKTEENLEIINTRNREHFTKGERRSTRDDRHVVNAKDTIVIMNSSSYLIKSLKDDTEHHINRSDFVTFKTEENLSENAQSILDGQLQLEEGRVLPSSLAAPIKD